jgi:formate hydrogenlyase subunit 6/NADH:ubiquinone oxidoreductase subunit I
MAYLTFKERTTIPTYDNPEHGTSGRVEIDHEKCNGCGNCALICPGDCLYVAGVGKNKKAYMIDTIVPDCMSCNDCLAMCTRDAIKVSTIYDFGFFYKILHRGGLAYPRNF